MDKPVCNLIGTDGNVFSLIAPNQAFKQESYNDMLCLLQDYVEV